MQHSLAQFRLHLSQPGPCIVHQKLQHLRPPLASSKEKRAGLPAQSAGVGVGATVQQLLQVHGETPFCAHLNKAAGAGGLVK